MDEARFIFILMVPSSSCCHGEARPQSVRCGAFSRFKDWLIPNCLSFLIRQYNSTLTKSVSETILYPNPLPKTQLIAV